MNEQRITPRSSAFPRRPRDSAPAPERASAAETEGTRAASVEIVIHGDPSASGKTPRKGTKADKDNRTRVEWVRPTDLIARAAAGGMARSAEWNMRAHRWLRAQPRRVAHATADGVRKLAPVARFGHSRTADRQTPGRSAPGG